MKEHMYVSNHLIHFLYLIVSKEKSYFQSRELRSIINFSPRFRWLFIQLFIYTYSELNGFFIFNALCFIHYQSKFN